MYFLVFWFWLEKIWNFLYFVKLYIIIQIINCLLTNYPILKYSNSSFLFFPSICSPCAFWILSLVSESTANWCAQLCTFVQGMFSKSSHCHWKASIGYSTTRPVCSCWQQYPIILWLSISLANITKPFFPSHGSIGNIWPLMKISRVRKVHSLLVTSDHACNNTGCPVVPGYNDLLTNILCHYLQDNGTQWSQAKQRNLVATRTVYIIQWNQSFSYNSEVV